MSFHTTSAIAYCYDHNTIGPSLSALLCEIVKSINCVYIERLEACNNTSNISANQILEKYIILLLNKIYILISYVTHWI
jgi:hypothetical protein